MLTKDNDNDDSGCTSDGEELPPDDVFLEKRMNGTIIRQNTYTVTSSTKDVQEKNTDILQQEDLESVTLLQRQNTYTVKQTEVDFQSNAIEQAEVMERFTETCKTIEHKYETSKYQSTSEKFETQQIIHEKGEDEVEPNLHKNEIENDLPLNIVNNMEYKIESDYNEPGDALSNDTEISQSDTKKEEDQYVTAEEVRNQKHKLQVSAAQTDESSSNDYDFKQLVQGTDEELATKVETR